MLDSSRSDTRCHANCCLYLHCFMPLKAAQVPRLLLNHSLSTVGGHRPRDRTTGHGRMVIDQRWGHPLDIFSRPTLNVADRPSLPAGFCFCCSRRQTVHGKEFARQCVHDHPPYHAMNSREYGSRPSDHQSCISMHDGQGTELHNLK